MLRSLSVLTGLPLDFLQAETPARPATTEMDWSSRLLDGDGEIAATCLPPSNGARL